MMKNKGIINCAFISKENTQRNIYLSISFNLTISFIALTN